MRLPSRYGRLSGAVGLALLPLLAPAAAQEGPAPPPDAAPPATAKPVAVFPEFSHDFGEVTRGQHLRHVFVVKNTGNADLQILNVAPT